MRDRVVRTVCVKELLDAARDPRALLYVLGLPLFFFPAILLVLEYFTHRTLGTTDSPPYAVLVTHVEGAPWLYRAVDADPDLDAVPSVNPWLGVVQRQATIGLEPDRRADELIAAGVSPHVNIYVDYGAPGARAARERVRKILEDIGRSRRLGRTAPNDGRRDAVHLSVSETIVGGPQTQLGFVLGLFPYFLVVLMLVGASHMAIDITAGEKERRTLETLLVTPAGRFHLLIGKGAATVAGALLAGGLGMAGFAIAALLAKSITHGTPHLLTLPPRAFWIMGLGSLPVAFFLSALLLALGTFARSSKEGQTYASYLQMPLLLLALVASFLPIEPNPALYLVPLLGTNLMQKEYLLGEGDFSHAATAAGATLLLALVMAALAARIFSRASVLFRE
jgi:sodium transport system permease protein